SSTRRSRGSSRRRSTRSPRWATSRWASWRGDTRTTTPGRSWAGTSCGCSARSGAESARVTTYLLARVVRLVLVWMGITLATFSLLRLSGDPGRLILGGLATAEAVREFQRLHGLDRPLPAQYLAFVGGVLVGDFGRSLRFEQPILPIILERLP